MEFEIGFPQDLFPLEYGKFPLLWLWEEGYPLIIKSIFRNMNVFGSWNAQIFPVILDTIGILKGCNHLTWDVENPVNTWINYLLVSAGAGFQAFLGTISKGAYSSEKISDGR